MQTKSISKDEDDDKMEADTKEVSDLIPQHNEVPLSTNFLDNNVKGSQNVLPDDKLIKKSETTKDDSSLNNASDSENQVNKENIDNPERNPMNSIIRRPIAAPSPVASSTSFLSNSALV